MDVILSTPVLKNIGAPVKHPSLAMARMTASCLTGSAVTVCNGALALTVPAPRLRAAVG